MVTLSVMRVSPWAASRVLVPWVGIGAVILFLGCQPRQLSERTKWVQMGTVLVGGDLPWEVEREVRFENRGGSPILIRGASTSCGCLRARISPGPLLPGQHRALLLSYVAGVRGFGPDMVEAWVVTTNAGLWRYAVSVTTLPRMEIRPTVVRLGYLPMGQGAEATFTLTFRTRSDEAKPIGIRSVVTDRGHIEVDAGRWTRSPGSIFTTWKRPIRVVLGPATRPMGPASDNVRLTFDRPVSLSRHGQGDATVTIAVTWHRIPEVRASPEIVILNPGQAVVLRLTKSVTRSIRVRHLRIEPPIEGLAVEGPAPPGLPCSVIVRYGLREVVSRDRTTTLVVGLEGSLQADLRVKIVLRAASHGVEGAPAHDELP